MRRALTIIAALAAALTLIAAGGSPRDRATGGGQVLIGDRGAGDTIAFTAEEDGRGGHRGEVQYVDRQGGTGQAQTVKHGTVDCLRVEGNTAVIQGTWEDRDGGGPFEIYVVDNGEGAAADSDIVTVNEDPTPDCTQDDDEGDDPSALARGNVQVHDAAEEG